MTLFQFFKNITPYIRPYKWLVKLALILTCIGALTTQVNAHVLQYTVLLVEQHKPLKDGWWNTEPTKMFTGRKGLIKRYLMRLPVV